MEHTYQRSFEKLKRNFTLFVDPDTRKHVQECNILQSFDTKSMLHVVKDPYTAISTGPTGCGKTVLALNLLEKEYKFALGVSTVLIGNTQK